MEEDLSKLSDTELAERIQALDKRLYELYLRQSHPKDFPTHGVHDADRLELKRKESELAELYAEREGRAKPRPSTDPRLKGLPPDRRKVAEEILTLNDAWDTEFTVFPSIDDDSEEGLRIQWQNDDSFAEFGWMLFTGRLCRKLTTRSKRGGSRSEMRMPARSLKNVKFAQFLRRFAK